MMGKAHARATCALGFGAAGLLASSLVAASGPEFVRDECKMDRGREQFLACAAEGVTDVYHPDHRAITVGKRILWVYKLINQLDALAHEVVDEGMAKPPSELREDGLMLLDIASTESFGLRGVNWSFETEICGDGGYAGFALRTSFARLLESLDADDKAVDTFNRQCGQIAKDCEWEKCPELLTARILRKPQSWAHATLFDETLRYVEATRSAPRDAAPSAVSKQLEIEWGNNLAAMDRYLADTLGGEAADVDLTDEQRAELEAAVEALAESSQTSQIRYNFARELGGCQTCAAPSYEEIKSLDVEMIEQRRQELLELEPGDERTSVFNLRELGIDVKLDLKSKVEPRVLESIEELGKPGLRFQAEAEARGP